MFKVTYYLYSKTRFVSQTIIPRNLASIPKNSFQLRIIDYFKDTLKVQELRNELPKYYTGNFTETNTNDLVHTEEILKSIKNEFKELLNEQDAEIKKEKLSDLDTRCFTIFRSLTIPDILYLLNEFYKVTSNELSMLYFYDKSITLLFDATEKGLLNNHEKVQFLFFLTFKNENVDNDMYHLKSYLPDICDLSLFDQCIAAQSFYNTSIKLEEHELRPFEKVLENNLDELINDPNLLIPLCKLFMINKPTNEFNLNYLSKTIAELQRPLDFHSIACILSLYAEALIFDPKAIDQLVKNSIELINKDICTKSYSLSLRHIDMFLWSISYLGITLTLEEKLILRTCIEERFEEYKTNQIPLSTLVNTMLCLHMLRCWSTKLIRTCFATDLFGSIFYKQNVPWKVKTRLELLITQITLEMKMKCPKNLMKHMKVGYTPSNNVNLVAQVASELVGRGIIRSTLVECPIDAIKIPGVTIIANNNTYHVDVLDNTTCLRNTNIPHGLTNLKLRLLSRLRYRQILINGSIFEGDSAKIELAIDEYIVKSIKYGKAARFL